eukprot:CAMPEP_0198244844 /NCGR_PEP_ID=MMETSP1446-20131203/37776_1 /TAXON_ID=1461542 ORGANISM="Unidentified sp, Strain CCMP2111" /NCGR_SAMPLE_ID=MMETSP1446 /ASSEMBLY_ACC=CAM_ASM_001112 /LENGTH=39 /DNA_ID= /DNA_START= /DNA_END= /DNA_ORIENTATION=
MALAITAVADHGRNSSKKTYLQTVAGIALIVAGIVMLSR